MQEKRQEFIEWMERKDLKGVTIKDYLFYFDKIPIEITQETIDSFLTKYNNGVARSFIRNYLQYFKRKDIEVVKQTGRKKQRIPKLIDEMDVLKIEEAMSNERNKIMLMVTYYAGLRVGELIKIRAVDFNYRKWDKDQSKSGEIIVFGKGDKQGIGLIPPSLMFRIRNWINTHQNKVVTNPEMPVFKIKEDRWAFLLNKASLKALDFKLNPHSLRHSRATNLFNRGLQVTDIKEFLRHSDISSTQIYIHIDKEKLNEVITKLGA